MQLKSTYALLVIAPLTIAWMGCHSTRSHSVSDSRKAATPAASPVFPSSRIERLMQIAARYEQQSTFEAAARVYRQVLIAEPGHEAAQQRLQAIEHRLAGTTTRPAEQHQAEETAAQPAPQEDGAIAAAGAAASGGDADSATQATALALHEQTDEPADDDLPVWARGAAPTRIAEAPSESETTAGWDRTSLSRLCPNADETLRPILTRLDEPQRRTDGLAELAALEEDAFDALPAVEALTEDEGDAVKAHAVWAVWAITGDVDPAVMQLEELLRSDHSDAAQVSAFFLGAIGPDAAAAADTLRALQNSSTGATRLHAAEALLRIEPDSTESLVILLEALRSEQADLRWLAAIALSNAPPDQADAVVPALAICLNDPDHQVCSAAALSLGTFGASAKPAIAPLQLAALHDAEDVRTAATTALACIPE